MDVRERITAKLLEHGVRPTGQRLRIALHILDRPCHFSAEQLLASLRKSGVKVSKATVYNTLSLFSRHGLLKQLSLDPMRLVYDSTTAPHHHFWNVASGELTDIPLDEVRVSRVPPPPRSLETESVEVLIRVRPKRET
jgi:Fur family iron response transcriptional regulator